MAKDTATSRGVSCARAAYLGTTSLQATQTKRPLLNEKPAAVPTGGREKAVGQKNPPPGLCRRRSNRWRKRKPKGKQGVAGQKPPRPTGEQRKRWLQRENTVRSCRLQAAGCRRQAASCKLQAPGSKLQAPSSMLQAPGSKLQAAIPSARNQLQKAPEELPERRGTQHERGGKQERGRQSKGKES